MWNVYFLSTTSTTTIITRAHLNITFIDTPLAFLIIVKVRIFLINKCSFLSFQCMLEEGEGYSKTGSLFVRTEATSSNYSNFFFGINLLKPSGFFTYHHVLHSKILLGARFALSVLYGYQNRQRLLLYTSLTDWFL